MVEPITISGIATAIGGFIGFLQSLSQEPWTRYFLINFFVIVNNLGLAFVGIGVLETILSAPINAILTLVGLSFSFYFPVFFGISSLTIITISYPLWSAFFWEIMR